MRTRVYYHDTDCGGVVYYSNYLKYIEEARTEYFESRGLSLKKLAEEGTLFVVARQEVDYKSPAVYGDVLDVETAFTEIGTVKMVSEHRITNQDGKVVVLAKTIMVCVGPDIRPKAIPDALRSVLSGAARQGPSAG